MNKRKAIIGIACIVVMTGCQSYKQVPYLQSYEELNNENYEEIVVNEVNQADTLYDARIQPKDLLTISVNTSDPEAAAPFNLTVQTPLSTLSLSLIHI